MIQIPCPNCKKLTPVPDVESYNPCSSCGQVFSALKGLNQKKEVRQVESLPYYLKWDNREYRGKTFDSSGKGMGLEISEKPFFKKRDFLELIIGDFPIKAQVMWIKALPEMSMVGLLKEK